MLQTTVFGTATSGAALQFQQGLSNGFTPVNLDDQGASGAGRVGAQGTNTPNLYYITKGDQSVTIPASGGYFIESISGGATIQGSAGGNDNVLVAAVNPRAVYNAVGGANNIIFVSGNNTYNGGTGATAGNNDTVVAGSGFDTIRAGQGKATIFTGTGNASIYLNDTVAATPGVPNQIVWVHDGRSTVWANGVNDGVGSDWGGQTINGNTGTLTVLLGRQTGGDTVGSTVNGGSGLTAVFDGALNTRINGGSGALAYISLGNSNASIVASTGAVFAFGAAGDNITASNLAGDTAPVVFVGGAGTERFDGSQVTTTMQLFGLNASSASVAAGINTTMIAGSGNDTLFSGSGNETLTGGAGNNLFFIQDAVGTTNITITDFAASGGNSLSFGFTSAQVQTALNTSQVVSGNLRLTFGDGTTVTFVGITNVNDISGKIG